ncbi:RluA family pseudouridine synthase [Facklamia sp. DSM 111018]|uniref:Pseudouridine synthase n=1 Tax=Facklamia lactis TaxID=2749967 RepID=A0ABS0LN24_9LACT|nr:RluA family pseudouridine synthase [Facklamia lactis]MBG9979871.1 RluA family pseudouridine synthase [Facklamia lactis]MBG9985449.1 RluA family pseudouridine synthase [Facklamia lactis]
MNSTIEIQLQNKESDGGRLDKVLQSYLEDMSRSSIQKLIKDQQITVNGKIEKANYKLIGNEVIQVNMIEEEAEVIQLIPEKMVLDIQYEDDAILVINKPAGIVVHPSKGHPKGTLVNGLYAYLKDNLSSDHTNIRPGIVHRIDKDTSGLLVVAKHDLAHAELAKQLENHTMGRTYYALVNGVIKEESGHIEMPVKRDPSNRLRWHVDENGKEAITDFEVLKRWPSASLVKVKLKTGRTHQIRIHMEAIGHPIIGDPVYRRHLQHMTGEFTQLKEGQLLHAKELQLYHPTRQEAMKFTSPLPERMLKIINQLDNR